MPGESIWEKLIERASLTVIVIGVIVLIISAAGGLPLGNPPLQIVDLIWRVVLGAMGFVLTIVGLVLLVREERSGNLRRGVTKKSRLFLVNTYPRSQHSAFFAEVEKLVPQAAEIILIATGLNMIWEKHVVDLLIERSKAGKARITVCMGNPFSPHVLDRLIEEETTGEHAPVGREGIERNVRALIQRLRIEGNPAGFSVYLFEHYPTFATLMFDKDIFVYPYGYQILGNISPIFHFRDDGSEVTQFFISNIKRIIRDAVPAEDVIRAHTDRRYYSDEWIEAAVYIVPKAGEDIYKLGSSVLGYDVWRQTLLNASSQDIADIRPYVGEAVEFGFHATIADALFFINEAEINRIKAELRMLTEELRPFMLSNFRIADRFRDIGDIVMLCDDESGTAEALHHELVARVYSSAISSNYLVGRTRKKFPEPIRRAKLMTYRYGSPYILKKFDLHFTLCAAPPADSIERNELVKKLQHVFGGAITDKLVEVSEVCLLTRRKGERYWRVEARYPLNER